MTMKGKNNMDESFNCDVEFKQHMLEYEEEIKKQYIEFNRNNTRTLNVIKNQLGNEYCKAITDCIKESEGYGLYELVKEPKGNSQDEDWGAFNFIWVDQWRDGGYVGDDFAGEIYIPLKKELFLKVSYEM